MVRELAEHLARSGHRVTVLTGWPHHPQGGLYDGWRSRFRRLERDESGFRIIRCGHSFGVRRGIVWRMLYYLTFALSTLVNGWAAGRADAVLCLSTPVFGSWTAWLLAKSKRARFLYDIFDLHPESARNAGLLSDGLACRTLLALDTRLCRLSDRIVTLSGPMKQAIARRGVDVEKVNVVPFWLDERRISPRPRSNPWRRRQGIDASRFVALFAGTIGYISGADVFAAAAEHLRDAGRHDILLLMVGEGVGRDAVERQAEAKALNNLRFLPFQSEEDLPDVQATADVGLVSLLPDSGASSIPSKVLGYMAAGRPVLASVPDDSGTAEMVRQAEGGIVVPPQEPSLLAEALCQLADQPEQRRRMGVNARQYFQRHFSKDSCCAVYERLLSGR